jgi:hypothetical protein
MGMPDGELFDIIKNGKGKMPGRGDCHYATSA